MSENATTAAPKPNGIGASVRRREDARFITGTGNYTDDINRPHQTYALYGRSDRAHALIKNIDVSAASSADGVVAVFVGQDMVDAGVNSLPCGWAVGSKDGSAMA